MPTCYLCDDLDPNETHFDADEHDLCAVCRVKLWEIAQLGAEFSMRDQTVSVRFRSNVELGARTVELSTGYHVQLDEEEGLEHLFNAVFGEVMSQANESGLTAERGVEAVYDLCLVELFFVAGQLKRIGSAMDVRFLLDEFEVHWNQIVKQVNPFHEARLPFAG